MTSYIPSSGDETLEMMAFLGCADAAGLTGLPEDLFLKRPLDLPRGRGEMALASYMKDLEEKSTRFETVLRGAGAYWHYIPAAVDAAVQHGEFVSAYTPYQAEMSQGLLCGLFEYQTMLCALTDMDVSNASLYDGAHALAEAVMMCRESGRKKVLLLPGIHPHYMQAVRTYCAPAGFAFETVPAAEGKADLDALERQISENTACVVAQSPNFWGLVEDLRAVSRLAREKGARFITSQNPISMALYTTAGEAGADICTGEGQPLGMPLSFGGPYLGFLCCTRGLLRGMGGRVVGQTADREGRRAFVLTLQAREQHIRREHARSAICSNQALCAMRAAAYLCALGPQGLYETALHCRENARHLREALAGIGVEPRFAGEHFHEFATREPEGWERAEERLRENGIMGPLRIGYGGENLLLWCATERVPRETAGRAAAIVKEALGK